MPHNLGQHSQGRTLSRRAIIGATAAVLVAGGIAAPPATAHSDHSPRVKVIASGLDNPRGLTLGRDGALYVAEAGRGGDGPCAIGPEGEELCYGPSGAITRIKHGHQRRVIKGLASLAESDGGFATGPARVDFDRGRPLVLMMSAGGGPESREIFGPGAADLGKLLRFSSPRKPRSLAAFPEFEAANNPDGGAGAEPGQEIDSNPYGLLAQRNGHVVTDAGGNDLLRVDHRGRISVLATFPIQMVDAPPFLGLPPGTQIPSQSVPTSVTRGPDGAYYVGELTGFPFPVGGARVWRVRPGHAPTVYASGFTNISDLKFDRRGRLYVLEMFHNGLLGAEEDPSGALIKVGRHGRNRIVTTDLVAPGGLVIDGSRAYVTNKATLAGAGEVVRIYL